MPKPKGVAKKVTKASNKTNTKANNKTNNEEKPQVDVEDIDYTVDGVEADVDVDAEQEDVPDLAVIDPTQLMEEKYKYTPEVRTNIIFVHPMNRITSEIMNKFEYTEVTSLRAKQIEDGGMVFTDVGELTDPLDQARKEILDKKCPLDITRMLTDKIAEKWHVNEMACPDF